MSNKNSKIIDKIRIFWEEYEKKIVLMLGIFLVAVISFEIGVLQGHKIEGQSLVIEKASEVEKIALVGEKGQVLGTESKVGNNAGASTDNKECVFVGSKNSTKYHKPDCQWAKRIKAENIVCFKNEAEAESRGYVADKCVK